VGTPRDITHTFPGAGEVQHQIAGRYIRVIDATGDVFIRLGGGSEVRAGAGQGLDSSGRFTKFSLRSAIAQTVQVRISDTPQEDNTQTVTATVTASIAPGNTLDIGGDVSIPALSSATVLAGDATRLAAVINNISDQELRIGGAGVGAATGVPLKPGEEKVIATTAIIACYNPHASVAKSVAVLPLREV